MLHKKVAQKILETYRQLQLREQVIPRDRLKLAYELFRERFGPERLQGMDGRNLLEYMHGRGGEESLVYRLEFKTDDEYPMAFGSIRGGSAHKFGLYFSVEEQVWIAGSNQKPIQISTDEAIEIARRQRDELIRGCLLLEAMPSEAAPDAYIKLQEDMTTQAPSVNDSAWGHKYFSLLYPDKLDDYHNSDYQRFHLIKMLTIPPSGNGRYDCAGFFLANARELGLPVNHLTRTLNESNGKPYNYWKLAANIPGMPGWQNWEAFRNTESVAVKWEKLGDLSDVERNIDARGHVRALMRKHYSDKPGRWGQEAFHFVANIQVDDIVLACEGSRVLGIAQINGPYYFESTSQVPHRRPVKWLSMDNWSLPQDEANDSVVRQLSVYANLVEVEKHILEASPFTITVAVDAPVNSGPVRLDGIPGRIQQVLERKGQVILYGPPGTGKTYWAELTARELAAHANFGQPFDALMEEQKQQVIAGEGAFARMCSFHPAYGYEDFLEGYRPESSDSGQMRFARRDGLFKRVCDDAAKRPNNSFYLIIDEINRGDIPRIFGELLTLLEKDKRGKSVLLPLSGRPFKIPDNVYVIGTMNTADRSIALLDTALRRRFGFVELLPDPALLGTMTLNGVPLGPWLKALNRRILEHIGRDARNLQIGHSYLLNAGHPIDDFERFTRIVQEDIIPLLEEYCYEDYSALERILGNGLVDSANQVIRYELFAPSRSPELVQALLMPSPELSLFATSESDEAELGDYNDGEDDLDQS